MITIWPQYLNRNLTTGEGRKISQEDSVKDPTINEIEIAEHVIILKISFENISNIIFAVLSSFSRALF